MVRQRKIEVIREGRLTLWEVLLFALGGFALGLAAVWIVDNWWRWFS